MEEVERYNIVTINYTGKLEDGTVFDSTLEDRPLSFIVGSGQMIKGLEDAVVGMKVGEKKEIRLPPAQAYGGKDNFKLQEVEKRVFSTDVKLIEGKSVTLQNEGGNRFEGIVHKIKEKSVIIDFNHPLAGKTLVFEIELLKIGGAAD